MQVFGLIVRGRPFFVTQEASFFMRSAKSRTAGLLTALALVGAAPTANVEAGSTSTTPQAVAAKSCSSGWTHARLPSGHKCLRAGQFCARRYNRYYHRYGFHCKTNGRLRNY